MRLRLSSHGTLTEILSGHCSRVPFPRGPVLAVTQQDAGLGLSDVTEGDFHPWQSSPEDSSPRGSRQAGYGVAASHPALCRPTGRSQAASSVALPVLMCPGTHVSVGEAHEVATASGSQARPGPGSSLPPWGVSPTCWSSPDHSASGSGPRCTDRTHHYVLISFRRCVAFGQCGSSVARVNTV